MLWKDRLGCVQLGDVCPNDGGHTFMLVVLVGLGLHGSQTNGGVDGQKDDYMDRRVYEGGQNVVPSKHYLSENMTVVIL